MNKTEKTDTVITLIILSSNVMGFLREMLLAKYFGATYIVDAYLMAQSIAFILFSGIMVSVATCYVPLYTDIKEEQGFHNSNRFTSGVINVTLLFAAGLASFGIIFAGPLVSLVAYGYSEQAHHLTVHFVRIGFMVAVLFSMNEIVKAFMHSNDGFIYEKIAGLAVNVFNIMVILLSVICNNYWWLMYGLLLGYAANLLLCLYFARLKNLRYQFNLPDRKKMKKILHMVFPIFIGSTAGQINSMLALLLAVGTGMIIYLFFMWLWQVKEISIILNRLMVMKKYLGWNQV